MKIAQIAPLVESVPPTKYGGTERVVSALTEALIARGHDVTLFASGNSRTEAELVSVIDHDLRQTFPSDISSRVIYTQLHLGTAYSQHERFDIIHDHTATFGGPFAQMCPTPTVITFHGVINKPIQDMFEIFTKPFLVTISDNQRKTAPQLDYTATVYNGLDLTHYPVGNHRENFLLFVGRICEQKGVHLAIEVALKANLPLIIAAKYEPTIESNKQYFTRFVEPKLSSQIRFIGEVDQQKRNDLMSRALASLHTATWDEPFGLTLIEAMACGCPVVALNHGAIPEVVKDGVSGYVVSSPEEMVEVIPNVGTISSGTCASYAKAMFGAQHMAESYERIYRNIITQQTFATPRIRHLSALRFGTKFSQLNYTKQ